MKHTDPSVSCKEQLCTDTQKHFNSEGIAAIRRTSKAHNTNTQQHTHLTLLTAIPASPSPSRKQIPLLPNLLVGHQQYWGWGRDPGAGLHWWAVPGQRTGGSHVPAVGLWVTLLFASTCWCPGPGGFGTIRALSRYFCQQASAMCFPLELSWHKYAPSSHFTFSLCSPLFKAHLLQFTVQHPSD